MKKFSIVILLLGLSYELKVYCSNQKVYKKKLSDWNIFERKNSSFYLSKNSIKYSVRNELFSDYATKIRTLHLKTSREKLKIDKNGQFVFPKETILTKTFAYKKSQLRKINNLKYSDIIFQPEGLFKDLHVLETRIFYLSSKGWRSVSYLWSQDQKDARLSLRSSSLKLDLSLKNQPQNISFEYLKPHMNQCKNCHQVFEGFNKRISPLSFFPKYLNFEIFSDSVSAKNQLIDLAENNLLEKDFILEKIDSRIDSSSQEHPIELRARTYLEINCAHCHSPHGSASTSGLYLSLAEERRYRLGICKTAVAAGNGGSTSRYVIKPQAPDDSLLLQRMASTNPQARMPELGRQLTHLKGLELIRAWILNLEDVCD